MFILNVLPLREFHSPKSQLAMVNVCVLSMYYHVLLFQISDNRQRTPGNWSELNKIRSIRPQTPRIMQNLHQLLTHLYYIMFQAPAPAENSQEFQRIMQILCNLHT